MPHHIRTLAECVGVAIHISASGHPEMPPCGGQNHGTTVGGLSAIRTHPSPEPPGRTGEGPVAGWQSAELLLPDFQGASP